MTAKTKRRTKLTLENIDKLIEQYNMKIENYPKISKEIVEKLVDEMMENVYPDTEIIPIKQTKTGATSGIRNTNPKWTYHEYGTGMIGSMYPHVSEVLKKSGWKYDINKHGERGWWYPTIESDPNPYKWTSPEGQLYGWTKGLVAERCFYDALERVKERLPDVAHEVFEKYSRSE